jgi:hypothetical protein
VQEAGQIPNPNPNPDTNPNPNRWTTMVCSASRCRKRGRYSPLAAWTAPSTSWCAFSPFAFSPFVASVVVILEIVTAVAVTIPVAVLVNAIVVVVVVRSRAARWLSSSYVIHVIRIPMRMLTLAITMMTYSDLLLLLFLL